uniref:NADH-ubiquinone oxidoreductase chain 3 n=1 Tax=Zygnema circumcarinatum TaxID=35869 RepID=A0A6N0GXN2_ZYGCR|nr:NADH-quinone oxidoreductase subunit A [Zygnema circumcarinatum]QKQ14704.1 NADH-quinone oxidoreductase subunit A [Zygnema circumcarinatum]WEL36348.1 NADH-quinone oxidoreductase subunit A [Zygnema circumcarinatum]
MARALLFVDIGSLVSSLLQVRAKDPNEERLRTYDSGEDPMENSWGRLNIRFYGIAIVFMLFQVETVILFPWATVWANPTLNEATGGLWANYKALRTISFVTCFWACICVEPRTPTIRKAHGETSERSERRASQCLLPRVTVKQANAVSDALASSVKQATEGRSKRPKGDQRAERQATEGSAEQEQSERSERSEQATEGRPEGARAKRAQ